MVRSPMTISDGCDVWLNNRTCDKSDNESGNSSGRDSDDQGFEAEEDNARLHSRTVRSKTRDK